MIDLTRRRINFALAAATLTRLLPAVSTANAHDGVRVIAHRLGSTEITGTPIRAVALEFSFVQAMDALGLAPIGIADDNQPLRIQQLLGKKVDYSSVGTRLEPNLELVSALAPDLIIADEVRHTAIYGQLSAIAPTIVLNSWEGGYQTIKDNVLVIAYALGDKSEGGKAIAEHEAVIASLVAQIPAGEKRRFLLAVAGTGSMSLHTSSSFTGSVFKAIGLIPAIESLDAVESGAGLERLIAVNPDVLLIATDPGGTVFDQWKDNEAFVNISAVKEGKVFEVDRNQFSRFRGLKTAEMIAREVLAKVYSDS
ncbi:ABC transporter substrate-binding protein [Phyllobacterium endophyticum]|uniref:Iron ABC transporter substrate-binding protein n=1 Tax=Phyllobacterium endophyticum TaxID=1149773 RepID=A0A2P7B1V8_9HYPH|nr:ABC transporter substrate-binding protein [Phyllobacterium endophyticum]MBB3238045.1 iron complex transport system substrate-binding protein [Phyllobacterium endophyticum]PSH60459.1 iron ABC transporter substrate-binding protein [Phyllobacterium endophyticum]TYR42636.1 ABC transporter substrate-binding protein [Phyllobacterium endophyticum]